MLSFQVRTAARGAAGCAALAIVALVVWACGGNPNGTSSSSGSGGTGGQGGTTGEGGLTVSNGSGGQGMFGCSADLRTIVDSSGAAVMTCPDDQGCLGGKCVAACEAAAGNHGNVGCDFRLATAGVYTQALPPCFAAFVANTWPRPAKLTVTRGGQTFDVTKFARIPQNGKPEAEWPSVPADGVPASEVAVLFLSHDPKSKHPQTMEPLTCPVPPALAMSTLLEGTGKGEAFRIVSDTPISMYDMVPYGGAKSFVPSAELLFPVPSWGQNYVVISTPKGTAGTPGPLFGQVLASEDNTTVQVRPNVELPAGADFPKAPAGMKATYTINAGQYLQWELPIASEDMSGTVVLSDKPVAVSSGNRFFRLQLKDEIGGESTHQQVLPVSALSNEYVIAPYETRKQDDSPENIHYRIVAAQEGTKLTFDPPIAAAPGEVGQKAADFQTEEPFIVKSQDKDHPFAIAQIMDTCNIPGGTKDGVTEPGDPANLGDEEFVVLLPPQQYLSNYVFFTDPSYGTTNLVLTRVKTMTGFKDVEVGCLGVVGDWKPAGGNGQYEMTTVDLVRAGKGTKSCQNGRQTAKSDGPFGIVVWGMDRYSSYAYPAGGYALPLTSVVIEPK